jgi:hypothetical protein
MIFLLSNLTLIILGYDTKFLLFVLKRPLCEKHSSGSSPLLCQKVGFGV